MTARTFEPPGRGGWISLRDHFPRAVTPEYGLLLADGMRTGEAIPMAAYGLPVKSLVVGLVHGHVYITPEPLIGPPTDSLPPRPLLWLLSRLVPAFRARGRAAEAALRDRPWLAEAEAWHATERQGWIDANRSLQDLAVERFDATTLAEHLVDVREHARTGYRRHFALHGPDLIPTGLLLAACQAWGITDDDALGALVGASPASLGRGPELRSLQEAVAAADRVPDSMESLRGVAGAELDAFLADHGLRLVTGYDLDSLPLGELPDLVVQLARRPAHPEAEAMAERAGEAALERLRAQVPTTERDRLERLVADARATFGVRDDNGALTAAWPMGLLRRAMLTAGRVLVERGGLTIPEHALEVTVDELVALLRGAVAPSADAVSARARDRAERSRLVAPPILGPEATIPIDALPSAMATISRAQLALRDTLTAGGPGSTLEGDGLSGGSYLGRALVATDPADALARMEPGDVLVAAGTTPAFNLALSIAGALVVEEGGLLSHAAVIARELRLPAVIGAAGCMDQIPDGALVEVDAERGLVRVRHEG
jgi:pyruvate,water dikinase